MIVDKQQAIRNGIERDIKRLEEQLEEAKQEMVKQLNDVDTRFGITKYAEQITVIKAKIETYRQSLIIIDFVFNNDK